MKSSVASKFSARTWVLTPFGSIKFCKRSSSARVVSGSQVLCKLVTSSPFSTAFYIYEYRLKMGELYNIAPFSESWVDN